MKKEAQDFLFDDLTDYFSEHWRGMPEYSHEDLAPFQQIIVSFASPEDVQRFAELIGQKITRRQKYLWYPEAEIGRYADKRYV